MWDEYLKRGTPEYEERRQEVAARLLALRHAIDYYYRVAGAAVPLADCDLSPLEVVPGEEEILERIALHLGCDGVHCLVLYDAASLLSRRVPEQAGYMRVLYECATTLRVVASTSDHKSSEPAFLLTPGHWYAAEFWSDAALSKVTERRPIFVRGVTALRTGRGEMVLELCRKKWNGAFVDDTLTLRVLDRGRRFLVAKRVDRGESLVVVLSELTWRWLGKARRMYPRRPGEKVQERLGRP